MSAFTKQVKVFFQAKTAALISKAKSEDTKNAFSMLSATILTQLMGILATPLLTRLFSPSSFGIFTSFNSVIALLSQLSNGKYGMAILVPQDENEAHAIWQFSRKIALLVAITILIICVISALIWHIENAILWITCLPIMLLLIGINESSNYYMTRLKAFNFIALSMIILSASNFISAIALGLTKAMSYSGLIIAVIIGQLASNIFCLLKIRSILPHEQFQPNVFDSKTILEKYKKYPLFGIPGAFVGTLSQQIFIFYFTFSQSSESIGLYGLANRIVQIPMLLISSTVTNVLLNKLASDVHNNRPALRTITKTSSRIALICIPIIIVTFISAPIIFSWVFGKEWQMSGVFAQYLIIVNAIRTIVSPTSAIFIVKNSMNVNLKWQLIHLVCSLFYLVLVHIYSLSILSIIKGLIILELILYLYYFLLILKEAKNIQ